MDIYIPITSPTECCCHECTELYLDFMMTAAALHVTVTVIEATSSEIILQ